MDRSLARSLLSDYLEDALSAEQRRDLEAYVQGDPIVKRELEALRLTLRSLSGLRPLPPPPRFARNVEHRIRRRSRGRFFGPSTMFGHLPFEWFSFVIIILLLLLYLLVATEPARILEAPPARRQGAGTK